MFTQPKSASVIPALLCLTAVWVLAAAAGRVVHASTAPTSGTPSDAACTVATGPPIKAAPLPDTHYLYNDTYGWFDTSHFNTGRPGQVLGDVRAAVMLGDGIIAIRQGLHDGITGYTGIYRVSEDLAPEDVTAAALGIYLDWSRRFEGWQAEPPQGLLGPTSSFAVEDLPSQYLGFMAAVLDVPVSELIACHLGPVTGSEEGPPDIVPADKTDAGDGWVGLARLENRTFVPLAPSEDQWRPVNWPAPLQMRPLPAGPDTWTFLEDVTWYLGDSDSEEHRIESYRSLNYFRPSR